EGDIRTSMISEEGREITLYHLRDGCYDVLSASCVVNQITFDTHMTAVRGCTLLIVPASVLAGFKAGNVHVRCFIYETLTMRFSDVMWMMQQTLFLRVDQRIAGYLLKRYAETKSPELALTHEQIALEINTAREVVARMMRNFVSDGLVEGGRGRIVIRDPEGLRRV
ncbi:MAG: Crp/Fnr family transcriptional regulator, partial [Eubacteriales bacterium]|nr:Crp/Fnr family transcriptional regulator [Eubacteriales bacterium]